MSMNRFGEKVICNPKVKLKKQEVYPLIDIDKIQPQFKTVKNVEEVEYTRQSCSKFQDHDILFARITPCLENGKVAIASTNGQDGVGSTELFVFRGIHGITNTDYVYYLLCTSYMRQLASNSMTGASGRQRADLTFIKKIKWQFPEIEKQERIAQILSQYDLLIEINNKRIKVLEQIAENLYKEWFVRFRFPGHETTEFENGIPKAWCYVKLVEAVTFIDGDRGSNYPTQDEFSEDGYCLFLNAGNVTKSGFDFTNCSYITKEKDTLLKKGKLNYGDVVLTTRGTVGNSAFYNTNIKNKNVRINSGMVIIRGKELLSSEYIYTLLNDDYIKAMISLYSSGSAQPQLPIKDLKRIRILIPNEKTMKQFTELVKKVYDEISIVNMCNLSIIKQRDLLLPRLMSGKLEV